MPLHDDQDGPCVSADLRTAERVVMSEMRWSSAEITEHYAVYRLMCRLCVAAIRAERRRCVGIAARSFLKARELSAELDKEPPL